MQALKLLSERSVTIERASSLYLAEPVEAPVQPWFLNGVARVRSPYKPRELLGISQTIETHLGRRRQVHHGPRTIDLDLLLVGVTLVDTPELTLPHPRLHLRRFMLIPLAEIAPDLIHPKLECSISELLTRCSDRSAVIRVGSLPDL